MDKIRPQQIELLGLCPISTILHTIFIRGCVYKYLQELLLATQYILWMGVMYEQCPQKLQLECIGHKSTVAHMFEYML